MAINVDPTYRLFLLTTVDVFRFVQIAAACYAELQQTGRVTILARRQTA